MVGKIYVNFCLNEVTILILVMRTKSIVNIGMRQNSCLIPHADFRSCNSNGNSETVHPVDDRNNANTLIYSCMPSLPLIKR